MRETNLTRQHRLGALAARCITPWALFALCFALFGAAPALTETASGAGPGPGEPTAAPRAGSTGPANPDDARVYLEWEEKILREGGDDANDPGIEEPMLSAIFGRTLRIPHTDQVTQPGVNANVLSLEQHFADDPSVVSLSSTGHPITPDGVIDPQRVLGFAVGKMSDASGRGDVALMREGAEEALDVLLGRTEGKIFDGFPLLNFNRWNSPEVAPGDVSPDSVPGEYKMKRIRPVLDPDSGEQLMEPSWKDDGTMVRVWQIDVDHLWYGQQFDSDTFLLAVPLEVEVNGQMVPVSGDDTLRINWTIYSLVEEDFAPTQVMRDALVDGDVPGPKRGGTVRFPYKGEDTVWVRVLAGSVNRLTVQHTALRFIRGIYTWGWNVHPPRIQFIQPVFEYRDPDTGEAAWDWQAQSFVTRNREDLTIDAISDSAPEKKIYTVAEAALADDADPAAIHAMLNDPDVGPGYGTWHDWLTLMSNQRQLPPEARELLEQRGETIADYDFFTVYMNNEMYGEGTLGHTIRLWSQGEVMRAGLLNLDRHTHYFRNVGFGAPLHRDLARNFDDGIFSFEIMNFKPLHGAPKVAEVQYRAGWGFRPHYGVVQQQGVYPRESDQRRLRPYLAPLIGLPLDAEGNTLGPKDERRIFWGYQFRNAETEPFPFNPPPFIVSTVTDPAFDGLRDLAAAPHHEENGNLVYRGLFMNRARGNPDQFLGKMDRDGHPLVQSGLVIGQRTEGWGRAEFCPESPLGQFCPQDLSANHPLHLKNWPAPNDPAVPKTELRFPPFLRNPCQEGNGVCGDIIPPTSAWEPFLFLNPRNGTLYNDPNNPSSGYWTDYTYAHGRTIPAGHFVDARIEMPRAGAQLFYQFDDLFHDNAIFSPHPILDTSLIDAVLGTEAGADEPGVAAPTSE